METWLAIAHYLSIFILFAALVGEFVLLRVGPSIPGLRLLGRLDIIYGVFAVMVLATGALRVFYGEIPLTFWVNNPLFWTKVGLFVVVGVLSIGPTLRYLRWGSDHKKKGLLPDERTWRSQGPWVHAQLGLLLALPVLAVLMQG